MPKKKKREPAKRGRAGGAAERGIPPYDDKKEGERERRGRRWAADWGGHAAGLDKMAGLVGLQ